MAEALGEEEAREGEGVWRAAALLEPQAARVRMATTWATNLKEPTVFWANPGVKANAKMRRGLRFRYDPRLKQGSDPHPQGLGLKGP